MIVSLQLHQDASLDSSPKGWFLPGDSVACWLEELTRCGLAEIQTRLFVIPKSLLDRSPAGLLVIPERADSILHKPYGITCRLIAGKLVMPMDAVLQPPVSDAELASMCPLRVYFFHPVLGLSGFETDATLRIWDFIDLPAERPERWNFARPGAASLPELRAVILMQPPSIEDIFGGAQEEIGSESPLDLPPAPNEPGEDILTKSKQNLQRWFAKGVAGATKLIPHTGIHRTWVNDAEDWANRHLHGHEEQLEKIRHKELHRLLDLFDQDPEAALRHAIPLSAFAHRGIAPPGGRLGSHSPNFDLSKLGGRAADFWNVPATLQENLRSRYRAMADREMQLGRHRRAAYIYAELLGDLVSAANALKQGKHFHEAALLYEEHLKSPLDAARCLAEAGLLTEAIERYEKLGRWLDVAELNERLGNLAAAEIALRRVVQERIAKQDLLGAAKLLDEQLHATDEALELLLRAWPLAPQAAGCAGAAIQLLGRVGRHEAAMELIARFSRDSITTLALPLLAALIGPARDYPDELVRHRLADFSRVLIARQLSMPSLKADQRNRFTEYLIQLAPQDRLLARDANRYLMQCREDELRVRRLVPPPIPGNKPKVIRRFDLPRQIEWLHLRGEKNWFFALGVTPKRLTLVRGVWEGGFQSLSWECPAETIKNNGLVFEPAADQGKALVLKTLNGPDFAEKRFPGADLFFSVECIVDGPAWLTPQHWPVAFSDDSVWTAHVAVGRGIISSHDKRGNLQRTIDVTDHLLTGAVRNEKTQLCLSAVGSNVAIALGNRLVVTRSDGTLMRLELSGQVIGLICTLPHTRAGLAIMLEHGAEMHWIGSPGLIQLDRDIASPKGAFISAGPLALVSDSALLLIDVDSNGVQKVTRSELIVQRPVGICSTASAGQFAVLGPNGEMTLYQA